MTNGQYVGTVFGTDKKKHRVRIDDLRRPVLVYVNVRP